jgi:hypothetical protein
MQFSASFPELFCGNAAVVAARNKTADSAGVWILIGICIFDDYTCPMQPPISALLDLFRGFDEISCLLLLLSDLSHLSETRVGVPQQDPCKVAAPSTPRTKSCPLGPRPDGCVDFGGVLSRYSYCGFAIGFGRGLRHNLSRALSGQKRPSMWRTPLACFEFLGICLAKTTCVGRGSEATPR